jgi:cell division protein FtsQ
MSDFLSVSEYELEERRKRLRQQRRWKGIQSFWRLLLVMGMAGGVIWGATQPLWLIRSPNQVTIEGNELLSSDAILSVLPIHYPQSLLTIQPEKIARILESKTSIATVEVTRHLYPPELIIKVQERRPVAIAYPIVTNPESATPQQRVIGQSAQPGLLDEQGFWIPLERYTIDQSLQLPSLKVFGLRDEYRSEWSALYQAIGQSPVEIYEIDWREPTNLILKSEMGEVHIGTYTSHLPEQLRALDRLRHLPQAIDFSQVAYIDLKDPQTPIIQMMRSVKVRNSDQPEF